MEQHNRISRRKKQTTPKKTYYLLILVLIQTISIFYSLYLLYTLTAFGLNYWIIILALLFLITVLEIYILMRRAKILKTIGIIMCVILTLLSGLISFYTSKSIAFLNSITGNNYENITYDLYVLKESKIQNFTDLTGEKTCIVKTGDKGIEEGIQTINKQNNITLDEKVVDKYTALVDKLYNKECSNILFNTGFTKIATEYRETFESDVRKIGMTSVKVQNEKIAPIDVANGNFNIYLSGNDSFGSILSNGRSDVNMLISINQKEHKALITNIPRDYYVPLACMGGAKDKLTHAGVYGVDCSMKTVESLFNTKVNHYVKVNFTSFMKVIDVLGGVDVNVKSGFTTGNYTFQTGMNHMNAEQALAFSRDRYHQDGGDRGRGENQQLVIQAIMKKLASPSTSQKFLSVLDSFENSFTTNVTASDMTTLFQQLVNKGEYQVTNQSVDGAGGMSSTYTYGSQQLSVIFPNENTVDTAARKIQEYLQ